MGKLLERYGEDWVKVETRCGVIYVRAELKFYWRDFWVGAYLDEDGGKLVICLLPMLPLIIEWAGARK